MPSQVVTSNTTAQSVAAERKNAVVIPTSVTINNVNGGADRTIRIQDIFTPAVTNGTSSPSEQTVERWRATVGQGLEDTWDEEALKGIKCLGALKVIGDAIDASCYITVGYKQE